MYDKAMKKIADAKNCKPNCCFQTIGLPGLTGEQGLIGQTGAIGAIGAISSAFCS